MTGTNLQGTNIISMIVPTNHADTYATHDSFYGKGGWREVDTLDERNNIPEERRRIGMAVYVRETYKAYILKNSLSNAGWVPFNIDDEDYITEDELETALSEALANYTTRADVQALLVESGYATKQWVIDYVGNIDLTDYQKKADSALQTENKTIVGAINELNSKPHIDTYSKSEEDALLALKADKSEIIDAYSKEESDAKFITEHQDISGKADKVDTYTKAEIDDLIRDIPVADNVYTKEETNVLLATKADTTEVTNVANRVTAIEEGDIFVPTEDYEVKCAEYEEQIAALQAENVTLRETVTDMKTRLDYVYDLVTTPHYDVLPDEG